MIEEITGERIEIPDFGDPHPQGAAIYLLVESETIDTGSRAPGHDLAPSTPHRVVHAISRWAGGEVRGYLLAEGKLRVRRPSRPVEWPELDALVTATLKVPLDAADAATALAQCQAVDDAKLRSLREAFGLDPDTGEPKPLTPAQVERFVELATSPSMFLPETEMRTVAMTPATARHASCEDSEHDPLIE